MQKWKLDELPQPLREKLSELYGGFALSNKNTGTNKILYVREISEREKAILSSDLMVQSLYRVRVDINFFRFNRLVSQLVSLNEVLRSNFFGVGDEQFAVVFNGRESLPEIVRHNLCKLDPSELSPSISRLMEADRRRGFDLSKGHLIRFTILHIGAGDYAILVTASQALNETFGIENFVRTALEFDPPAVKDAFMYSDFLIGKTQVESSMQRYWVDILADLPTDQKLPYYKPSAVIDQQDTYRAVVPYEIVTKMHSKAKGNRLMLMTILQTAWGMMLQEFNQSNDAAFCSLVPSRDKSAAFNTIPVRLKISDDQTVGQLVNAQFQQVIVSQPYSRFGWSAIEEVFGESKIFNHFLSFTDFMSDEKLFETAETSAPIELVAQKYWNARDARLGVYFTFENDEIAIVLKYNDSRLTFDEATMLTQRYMAMLRSMMIDWDLSAEVMKNRLTTRLDLEAGVAVREDSRSKLLHIISKMQLLQTDRKGTLQQLLGVARLETFFEGDRIFGEMLEKNLVLVAEGMLARSIDVGDGWFNMLDMVVEGLPINEAVLLDRRRCNWSAEVVSEQATLLFIPLDDMTKVLNLNPLLWQNIALHALHTTENIQSIWVQA
ncbi:MAG: hypothetical protein IJ668_03215 [Selenomonadaceae bacterium]|nr:hypothetical protein [Selenomonadaceae bacterium]